MLEEASQNAEISSLSVDARIGVDLKDEKRLRVSLETADDALYVGTLYVGAPHSQPVKVIFDTGSEHLAITSALCNNQTAGNYHFSQESEFSKALELEFIQTESSKKQELEQYEFIDPEAAGLEPDDNVNVQEKSQLEESTDDNFDALMDTDEDNSSDSSESLATQATKT